MQGDGKWVEVLKMFKRLEVECSLQDCQKVAGSNQLNQIDEFMSISFKLFCACRCSAVPRGDGC